MNQYPEFEGIETMTVEDRAIYLLKLINRYTDVVDSAKQILKDECLEYIEKNNAVDPYLHVKSRTTTTVDNQMLSTAFPEVYERLYREGKLVAKAQDLKDEDDDVKSNVLSTSTSKWLEYKDKV